MSATVAKIINIIGPIHGADESERPDSEYITNDIIEIKVEWAPADEWAVQTEPTFYSQAFIKVNPNNEFSNIKLNFKIGNNLVKATCIGVEARFQNYQDGLRGDRIMVFNYTIQDNDRGLITLPDNLAKPILNDGAEDLQTAINDAQARGVLFQPQDPLPIIRGGKSFLFPDVYQSNSLPHFSDRAVDEAGNFVLEPATIPYNYVFKLKDNLINLIEIEGASEIWTYDAGVSSGPKSRNHIYMQHAGAFPPYPDLDWPLRWMQQSTNILLQTKYAVVNALQIDELTIPNINISFSLIYSYINLGKSIKSNGEDQYLPHSNEILPLSNFESIGEINVPSSSQQISINNEFRNKIIVDTFYPNDIVYSSTLPIDSGLQYPEIALSPSNNNTNILINREIIFTDENVQCLPSGPNPGSGNQCYSNSSSLQITFWSKNGLRLEINNPSLGYFFEFEYEYIYQLWDRLGIEVSNINVDDLNSFQLDSKYSNPGVNPEQDEGISFLHRTQRRPSNSSVPAYFNSGFTGSSQNLYGWMFAGSSIRSDFTIPRFIDIQFRIIRFHFFSDSIFNKTGWKFLISPL